MGSVIDCSVCPQCGGEVLEDYHTNGDESVGCLNPDCNYGWKGYWKDEEFIKTGGKATFVSVPKSQLRPLNELLMDEFLDRLIDEQRL